MTSHIPLRFGEGIGPSSRLLHDGKQPKREARDFDRCGVWGVSSVWWD
jgi:hypothetical protein